MYIFIQVPIICRSSNQTSILRDWIFLESSWSIVLHLLVSDFGKVVVTSVMQLH